MPSPYARLAFFKLNVPDMAKALAFYAKVFEFKVIQSFDEDDFLEHIMAIPGQEAGPNLLLVAVQGRARSARSGRATARLAS